MTIEGQDGYRYLVDRQGRPIMGPSCSVDHRSEAIPIDSMDPASRRIVRSLLELALAPRPPGASTDEQQTPVPSAMNPDNQP